jgi:ribosomal protein L35
MTKKSSRKKRDLEKPELVAKSFEKKYTRLIIGL